MGSRERVNRQTRRRVESRGGRLVDQESGAEEQTDRQGLGGRQGSENRQDSQAGRDQRSGRIGGGSGFEVAGKHCETQETIWQGTFGRRGLI